MQRIKLLDSMRGLAAVIVCFHHIYTRFSYLYIAGEPISVHNVLSFISDLNVEAVMFFFILSGFSIRLSLQKGFPVTKASFNEYVYRRLKRILPLYYVSILVTIVAGLIIHSINTNPDFNIKNFIGNILFLQCSKSYKGNWFAPYGDNGPLWSLSFEMFYYFLFPALMLFVVRVLKVKTVTEKVNQYILCFTFLLSLLCIFINNHIFIPYIAFAALFYIWYSGFFMADLYLQNKIKLDRSFILFILLAILTGMLYHLKPSEGIYKLCFASALTAAIFVFYLVRKKFHLFFSRYLERAFNFVFYYVGKGSYALYLLHYPVIMVLKNYSFINIYEVVLIMIAVIILCTQLEQFFVRKKWLFLKLQYVK